MMKRADLTKNRIEIHKKARTLFVNDGENLIRTFGTALGSSPAGHKEMEGDGKTPEGSFFVFVKNPQSKFHLSLGISYPSIEDAKRGLRADLISESEFNLIKDSIIEKRMPPQKTRLGGEIYIHGGGIDSDWTDGCIALKNEEMVELYELVTVGIPVRIFA